MRFKRIVVKIIGIKINNWNGSDTTNVCFVYYCLERRDGAK
jgi:hypothetical protein